jgi:uncharacterized protein (DUF1810 family)
MPDSFNLHRFVDAQDPLYGQVKAELAVGKKASHWMWFVFPQLVGLGHSGMARRFGIQSKAEAQAYWQHELLGPRLRECVALMLSIEGKTALEILGSPDNLKFHSSLTLFAHALPQEPLFARALEKYFKGLPDARTLELI